MTPNVASWHGWHGRVIAGCIVVILVCIGPSPSAGAALPTLSVSGSIDGLYPGFTGQMSVRVSNPFNHSIRLTTVTTTAEPVAAGCDRHLTIGDVIGQPIVPAEADVDIELVVSFARAAPDICQGISMPLMFTVHAADTVADDPPDSVLPQSGSNYASLINSATTTLAFGAALVLLSRRRRP